jgi:hypothetical protein
MTTTDKLETTQNRGFKVTLGGLTLSVQFGTGNYCSRRSYDSYGEEMKPGARVESPDAELALFGSDGEMLQLGDYDTVVGRVPARTVALVLGELALTEGMSDVYRLNSVRNLLGLPPVDTQSDTQGAS